MNSEHTMDEAGAREEPPSFLTREELRPDKRRSEAEIKDREWWRTLEDDDLISLE